MNSSKPTIGVITISFNQAQYLEEAILSIYSSISDPSRLRYVVVDPGSTDGSRDIIEKHKDKFSRVILEPDKGAANGLNKGFQACDADILGYINSDDRLLPGALDFVLNFFEKKPNVDILMGGLRMINAKGIPALRKKIPTPVSLQNYLDSTCLMLQQSMFFRRRVWEQVGAFNEENRTCWDGELLVDMLLNRAKIRTTNKVLADFRIHGTSISGTGRLIPLYREDCSRIQAKIVEAGVEPTSGILLKLKKICFLANPVRRFFELFSF